MIYHNLRPEDCFFNNTFETTFKNLVRHRKPATWRYFQKTIDWSLAPNWLGGWMDQQFRSGQQAELGPGVPNLYYCCMPNNWHCHCHDIMSQFSKWCDNVFLSKASPKRHEGEETFGQGPHLVIWGSTHICLFWPGQCWRSGMWRWRGWCHDGDPNRAWEGRLVWSRPPEGRGLLRYVRVREIRFHYNKF